MTSFINKMVILVSIVLLVIKRLNTDQDEKRFNLHVWCSNVACYADIESYTYQKSRGNDITGFPFSIGT